MEATESKLACSGCGASLEYSAGAQSLKCVYCGAITEIPGQKEAIADQPDLIIPMKVERQDLEDAVYEYLAAGDYTPDDLLESAVFSKVERLYVPSYLFNGGYEAIWTASFGYDRTETYTDYETDNNGKQRAVTRTRTVTDWRPVNGVATGAFEVFSYAGSRDVPLELIEDPVGRDGVTRFDAAYVRGLDCEGFSQGEGSVYAARGKDMINEVIDAGVKQHAQGDQQRDWNWNASLTGEQSFATLLPVCHLVFDYNGKSYSIWSDGCDARQMIADEAPVDNSRKQTVHRGFIPFGVGAAAAVFALVQNHYQLPRPGLLAAALGGALIYGLWRRHSILSYSLNLRQSLLAQRRASTRNMSNMSEEERTALAAQFQRPAKPLLARTAQDMIVQPLLALVTAAAIVTPGFMSRSTPASLPAPVMSAAVESPVPQPQAASSGVAEAPQRAQAAVMPDGLRHVVKSVTDNDWDAADRQLDQLDKAVTATLNGDRAAGRKANKAGLAAMKRKDYGAAVDAFQQGIEVDPGNIEMLNNLAMALDAQGKSMEADKALYEVLGKAPRRSVAWVNLAQRLVSEGDQLAASAALKTAVHLAPGRDAMVNRLQQQADRSPDEAYRKVVADVMDQLGDIPGGQAAAAVVADEAPAKSRGKAGKRAANDHDATVDELTRKADRLLNQLP